MREENFIPQDREVLTQRDPRSMKLTIPKSARTEVRKGKRVKEEHHSFNVGNSARTIPT